MNQLISIFAGGEVQQTERNQCATARMLSCVIDHFCAARSRGAFNVDAMTNCDLKCLDCPMHGVRAHAEYCRGPHVLEASQQPLVPITTKLRTLQQ